MSKRNKILVVLMVMIALAAAGIYLYRSHAKRLLGQEPQSESGGERRILYWHDPMFPQQRFAKPGRSPFMDMDLVPVYADEAQTGNTVSIDARVVQNIGVRIAQVEQGTVVHEVNTVGYVRPDEHGIEVVQARAAGWVERLHVATGDPVKRGQPLLELYAPDILAAQQEYLLALKGTQHDTSMLLAEAAKQKLLLLNLTPTQIEQLERAGKASRAITIHSPVDGVVTELNVRAGMAVGMDQPLYSLLDLSRVWVTAEIPEKQASWVAENDAAEIRVASLPGKVFAGKVEYLYPELVPGTRTLQARIVLNNPSRLLKPNMLADVKLKGKDKKDALLVPSEALIVTGERNVVIVAEGEGRFSPVEVEAGGESGDKTEILRGLSPGQKVVISGQFLIDSEASLKATASRLEEARIAEPALPASGGSSTARGH